MPAQATIAAGPNLYAVVRKLGSQGPFEILLARRDDGPAGAVQVRVKRVNGRAKKDAVRLAAEARIARAVQHANVIALLDDQSAASPALVVYEQPQGQPLDKLIAALAKQGGTAPAGEAVAIVGDLARGVQNAHLKTDAELWPAGIVHGAISPSDVVVGYDGVARLDGFGVWSPSVHWSDVEADLRDPRLPFLSPERVAGQRVEAASDVFSLGAILYRLTVGRAPFAGKDAEEIAKKIGECRPVPPRQAKPGYPAALERVVLKALSRKPADRFESCAALDAAMQEALGAIGTTRASPVAVGKWVGALFGVLPVAAPAAAPTTVPARGAPPAVAPAEDALPEISLPMPAAVAPPPAGNLAPPKPAPPAPKPPAAKPLTEVEVLRRELAEATKALSETNADAVKQLEALRRELDAAKKDAATAAKKAEKDVTAERYRAGQEASKAEARRVALEKAEAELAKVRTELDRASAAGAIFERDLGETRAKTKALQGEAEAAKKREEETKKKLEEAVQRFTKLSEEIHDLKRQKDDAVERAKKVAADAVQVVEEARTSAQRRIDAIRAEVERGNEEATLLLAQAKQEKQAAEKQKAEAQAALKQAETAHEATVDMRLQMERAATERDSARAQSRAAGIEAAKLRSALRAARPPLLRLSSPPRAALALPLPSTEPILGRALELERVERMAFHEARLITLVGPTGSGRTRFALEVAKKIAAPEQTFLLDVGGDETLLRSAIAHRFGVTVDPRLEGEEALDDLGARIASRGKALVLLRAGGDLAPLASAIPRWLRLAPEACFLVISPRPLAADGESLLEIGPLPSEGAESEATSLLVSQVAAVRGEPVDDAARASLAELAPLLEGLPLSIRLVAARGDLFSPGKLRSKLAAHPRASGSVLEWVLDWTWSILVPDEQRALAQLSGFEHEFTAAMAKEVVVFPDDGPQPPVADVVKSLERQALVEPAGPGWHRLHPAVRAFAAGRLEEAQAEGVAARRAAALLEVAQQAPSDERVQRLWAPILAALDGAPAGPALVDACFSLIPLVERHGPVARWLAWVERGLESVPAGESARRWRALLSRGRMRRVAGMIKEALSDFYDAHELAIKARDKAQEAQALTEVSLTLHARDSGEKARTAFERAIATHAETTATLLASYVEVALLDGGIVTG